MTSVAFDRDIDAAYRACVAITRERAANFSYGIRLLPGDKRRALSAVYAFARRVDDLADGPEPAWPARASPHTVGGSWSAPRLPADVALIEVERLRACVTGLAEGARAEGAGGSAGPAAGADPVMAAVADATHRFGLPLAAFEDLVDGVEMDIRGTEYRTFGDLTVYCRRVAGSIGRLSVAIFGAGDPIAAASLADDLGVAMQLTNVLRDVREDGRIGRRYLPLEDMERFDCSDGDLADGTRPATALIRFEAERARAWFGRGLRLLPLLDRRSAACVAAMTGIYRRLLGRIEHAPAEVFARRVRVPTWEKAWVAGASLARPKAVARHASVEVAA